MYLHFDVPGEKLIHRDLKPDNVLIADDLTAKVADFGESRRYDSREGKDRFEKHHGVDAVTMTMVGTPLYVFSSRCNLPSTVAHFDSGVLFGSGIALRRYSGATHASTHPLTDILKRTVILKRGSNFLLIY